MSFHGIVLIDLVGLVLIALITNLVRTRLLYPGYAVMWITSLVGVMLIISVPSLLELVTGAVGALFPASALSLLAFVYIFLTLILISVKISALSARQTKLIQTLGLEELAARERAGTSGQSPGAGGPSR